LSIIPKYPINSPELNPSEKIWAYIKQFYKNKVFENLENVKNWLHHFVGTQLKKGNVKSITYNDLYVENFMRYFVS